MSRAVARTECESKDGHVSSRREAVALEILVGLHRPYQTKIAWILNYRKYFFPCLFPVYARRHQMVASRPLCDWFARSIRFHRLLARLLRVPGLWDAGMKTPKDDWWWIGLNIWLCDIVDAVIYDDGSLFFRSLTFFLIFSLVNGSLFISISCFSTFSRCPTYQTWVVVNFLWHSRSWLMVNSLVYRNKANNGRCRTCFAVDVNVKYDDWPALSPCWSLCAKKGPTCTFRRQSSPLQNTPHQRPADGVTLSHFSSAIEVNGKPSELGSTSFVILYWVLFITTEKASWHCHWRGPVSLTFVHPISPCHNTEGRRTKGAGRNGEKVKKESKEGVRKRERERRHSIWEKIKARWVCPRIEFFLGKQPFTDENESLLAVWSVAGRIPSPHQ